MSNDDDHRPPDYLTKFFRRWAVTVTYLAVVVTIDVIVQVIALTRG